MPFFYFRHSILCRIRIRSVPVPLRQKGPVSDGPVPQHCNFLLWALFLIGIHMNPCNDLALMVQDPVAMKLTNTIFFFHWSWYNFKKFPLTLINLKTFTFVKELHFTSFSDMNDKNLVKREKNLNLILNVMAYSGSGSALISMRTRWLAVAESPD